MQVGSLNIQKIYIYIFAAVSYIVIYNLRYEIYYLNICAIKNPAGRPSDLQAPANRASANMNGSNNRTALRNAAKALLWKGARANCK